MEADPGLEEEEEEEEEKEEEAASPLDAVEVAEVEGSNSSFSNSA